MQLRSTKWSIANLLRNLTVVNPEASLLNARLEIADSGGCDPDHARHAAKAPPGCGFLFGLWSIVVPSVAPQCRPKATRYLINPEDHFAAFVLSRAMFDVVRAYTRTPEAHQSLRNRPHGSNTARFPLCAFRLERIKEGAGTINPDGTNH